MKKLTAILALTVVTAASSFAQGYITLNSSTKYIFDNFTTPGTAVKNANINVGFIWLAGSSQVYSALGSSGTTAQVGISSPWSSLTTLSGGWNWGSLNGTTVFTAPTIGTAGPAQGSIAGGSQAAVFQGSTSEAITVYLVAWSSAYSSPSAASTAGSAIGWSAPINYTTGSSGIPGVTLAVAGMSNFYVDTIAPTPEPGTMALAALGGASLLLFRRRK